MNPKMFLFLAVLVLVASCTNSLFVDESTLLAPAVTVEIQEALDTLSIDGDEYVMYSGLIGGNVKVRTRLSLSSELLDILEINGKLLRGKSVWIEGAMDDGHTREVDFKSIKK